MLRKVSFEPNEWYHCYNRGVEKRRTFENRRDYERFSELLYLCNSKTSIHRSNLLGKTHEELHTIHRGVPLVGIGAYALMPNHFHLLIQEKNSGGISAFMQKLGTAYTMYFNIRTDRVGGLFVKPFRAKHVNTDSYLHYVAQYIHLNPAELFEPDWKEGRINNMKNLIQSVATYPYSSFLAYHHHQRVENATLDPEAFNFLAQSLPPIENVIEDAATYYQSLSP